MSTERPLSDYPQPKTTVDSLDETELLEILDGGKQQNSIAPKQVERILHLLHLLTLNECTREDIFERLKDFYKVDASRGPKIRATSQSAGKMLSRDIQALEQIGYEINRSGVGNATRYSLVKGSGPFSAFLFSQTELDTLILLHTLFADPAKYAPVDATHPLPAPPPHNPFAEEIVTLVERLISTLLPDQKQYFDRWVRKPFVYFNMDTVTDYVPHRDTIDALVKFISARQQIQFEYVSMKRRQGTTLHEEVDPYYIFHQEGHLYLIGYSHKTSSFLEYRVDRIKCGSIKPSPQHRLIDVERRRRPIEFRYWLDGSIAKSGLSQRWLSQTVEREEVYIDEHGNQRSRVLVLAQAYSEWRILQQMHKYGDKAELVDPPELREKMRQEVERICRLYQK